MSVFVAGSFMTDLVVRTQRAPEAGETVNGIDFNKFFGGKGANQAVAARRMNAEVIMAGCVGNDAYGKDFLDLFRNEGINIDNVKISENYNTGCSLITVETSGQNRICIVAGSNLDFSEKETYALGNVISKCRVAVTQCEMRNEVADTVAKLCKERGVKFILNPAPARKFSDEVLSCVYLLTPNETELGIITGKTLTTDEDFINASRELIAKGVENVVVTLGSRGCLLVTQSAAEFMPSFKVKAVDTVGAGDSFTGSLAALIDEGYELKEALKISSAVGALAVGKHGAIPSMPYRHEVEDFLKNH